MDQVNNHAYLDRPRKKRIARSWKQVLRELMWIDYCEKQPEEKIDLIVKAMKYDLLHYRSSRRKKKR